MQAKLARAKHTVEAVEQRLAAEAQAFQTGEPAVQDMVLADLSLNIEEEDALYTQGILEPERSYPAAKILPQTEDTDLVLAREGIAAPEKFQPAQTPSVSSSAALISVCNIASRITGFVRTWAMAFALGATLLSSSYQVANNLPNMLYEMVVGGLLVTAFLPVYVSVKKRLGNDAGNAYASNLLSIVCILLILVTIICIIGASPIVYTQSFWSDQDQMSDAVFFFQFFAIQILFYGAGSILSGLLNANRDYLAPAIAPAINNLVVIASFFLYVLIDPQNHSLALLIIAIGNSLGVFTQIAVQWPSLKRNGIRLRFRVNLRDPALKETLSIGIPAVIIMVSSFVVVAIQNAASYSFAENGPSIILYARLWFTLPYAFLVAPITTTLFTEISDMQTENNIEGVKNAITKGTNQILFFMIPFMFYLIVFASPLISLYHAGAFTQESIREIAGYLAALALTLPLYGVNTYLQKAFSSLRILNTFAYINIITSVVQAALTAGAVMLAMSGIIDLGIESIAYAGVVFFLLSDIMLFAYLRKRYGRFGLRSMLRTCINATALGAIGAAFGGAALWGLEVFIHPIEGSILFAFAYIIVGGLLSLGVTFGVALKLRLPEMAFFQHLLNKVVKR